MQRSANAAFTSPVDVVGAYSPTGRAWLAIDGPWVGARPWYRVQIKGSTGKVLTSSLAQQPYDQAGENSAS